jgi:hypothetical protein
MLDVRAGYGWNGEEARLYGIWVRQQGSGVDED